MLALYFLFLPYIMHIHKFFVKKKTIHTLTLFVNYILFYRNGKKVVKNWHFKITRHGLVITNEGQIRVSFFSHNCQNKIQHRQEMHV